MILFKMTVRRIFFLLFTLHIGVFCSACKSDFELVESPKPSGFDNYIEESPIRIAVEHTFFQNIPYGENQHNVIDLWVPSNQVAKALIIYIHGGGFRSGDKSSAWNKPSNFGIGPSQIREFLTKNIAFASINYSLLSKDEKDGVLECLNDCKRALQFLRYHSSEFGYDGEKIGLAGTSAGAGSALWLAYHEDMSEPTSNDPLMRVSTKVEVVAVQETQSTYDIYRWETDVFPEGRFPLNKIRNTALGERLLNFYGVQSYDDLENYKYINYRKEVDILSMISAEDPTTYILNKQSFNPEKGNVVGNLLHSPYHAVALRGLLDKNGVVNEVYLPSEGRKPSPSQTISAFLIEHL